MSRIRHLTADDIEAVAFLYECSVRSGSPAPPANLVASFCNFFVKSGSPEGQLSSLVCVDDRGEIIGFLGVHHRRLILNGRRFSAVCSGPLIVEAKSRTSAVGAFLLRELLMGPQELTFTDGANEPARRLWERLGGAVWWLACHEWTHVFRPIQFSMTFTPERPNVDRIFEPVRRLSWPLAASFDALARGLAGKRYRRTKMDRGSSVENLTPESMHEAWPTLSQGLGLKPDYDVDYLRWLFGAMRAFRGLGQFRARLVRGKDKKIMGCYIYYHRRGGVSQVAQIIAKTNHAEVVLGHLFREADQGRSIALQGRLEPQLVEPLARLGVRSRYTPPLALVHAKDPAVYSALFMGAGLLTRADGEWWMTFQLEPPGEDELPGWDRHPSPEPKILSLASLQSNDT